MTQAVEQYAGDSSQAETLAIRFTMGDHSTQPGGIIIRRLPGGEFMVHSFSRKAGSADPRSFFWGFYTFDEAAAWAVFAEKVGRAATYQGGGGGLIQPEAITEGY